MNLMRLNPDCNVAVCDDNMVDNVVRNATDSSIITREEQDILIGTKEERHAAKKKLW